MTLKAANFDSFVEINEFPNSGVFALQAIDNVMDNEDFPIDIIIIKNKTILSQTNVVKGSISSIPIFKSLDEISKWTKYDGSGIHPEISNHILLIEKW